MKPTCCLYCGREILRYGPLVQHQNCCPDNPDRKFAWNKGLTKGTDARVAKNSDSVRGKTRSPCPPETRAKLREAALKNKLGGPREGSSRCKFGRYKGIWCDSSWELAFIIFTQSQGKSIDRCSDIRTYTYEGVVRNYHPDFTVNDEVIEIKGREDDMWLAKIRDNPDVRVIGPEEMKPILKDVIRTYGRNFTDLYDGKTYKNLKAEKRSSEIQKEVEVHAKRMEALQNIDFLEKGWVEEVARVLQIPLKKAKAFVKEYLPNKIPPYGRDGEKNSQFDTMWITDGTLEGNRKIRRGEKIPEGYRQGRVNIGTIWIGDGTPESVKKIRKGEEIPEGYDVVKVRTGTMWITNGTPEGNKLIKKSEGIPEGYRPGKFCS